MIISKQNSQIKLLRSLSDKKFRDEHGLFIVESVKLVVDAFTYGEDIVKLYLTETGKNLLFSACADIARVEHEIISDELFKCVSSEVSPQGVLATVKTRGKSLDFPKGNCLFLDGVSDPANVGAILRTAASAGFNDVYLADGADPFSPKAVRASMGGIFRVNIFTGTREQLIKMINLPLVVADMDGQNAFDAKISGNVCLSLGNEGHGVSDFIKSKANITLSIPMQNGMESLNVGVAGGILMYAINRNLQEI